MSVIHKFVSPTLAIREKRMNRPPNVENVKRETGDSFGTSKYLLALKDHSSRCCELVTGVPADGAVATESQLDWHSRIGIPPEALKRLKSKQTFTLAFTPWINGSVELINHDILQVFIAMILECKGSSNDLVYHVPLVQTSINPIFLHRSATKPELNCSQDCHQHTAGQRLKQHLHHKKRKCGVNAVNFDVAMITYEKKDNKLLVTWQGPYVVVRADPHSFRVRHLVTEDELDVHTSRLKFYADQNLQVAEEILEHVVSQCFLWAINQLTKHRWNRYINDYENLVSWTGLESVEDT
ncbi:LOW QUALITY PROTEIN: hypothetical protein PHMEG_0006709 [Phytophthora megakarya]|uniref:Integrase catalytic domain-containing protein n=1 Tax=Phytophthora megakarya TaxID=4795 RepID=A0A225WP67_9STRA|nr:LOW QUALITY PROTEIN: hypothetical protein PHMEG_0006709 [Phytophthora megakarya]